MKQLRSKTPDFHKEIQIQPVIHQEIQPVITKQIQPVINQKILPVVHKEIQKIIHLEIQPVITTEIQPIIHKKIQPVIFMENQTNIEEIIQQLEKSHNRFEKHIKQNKVIPSTTTEVKNVEKIVIKPYIIREEKHLTKKEIEKKTEREIQNMEIIEFVPYIQYKNGEILPYEKKEKKSIKFIPYILNQIENKEIKSNNTRSTTMEEVIAVNFISQSHNINFPMACKKTDIFSKIEEKLYHEFPELKSKKNYFYANGNIIDKSSTFEQNKIKTGNTILINEIK